MPAPYVLVGHSLGGVAARRFIQPFPGEVAGVAGVEPLYERRDEFMPEQFSLAGRPAQPPAEARTFGHVGDDQVALGRDESLRGE